MIASAQRVKPTLSKGCKIKYNMLKITAEINRSVNSKQYVNIYLSYS